MGNIRGIKDIVDSELEGRVRSYMWRKNPVNSLTSVGHWFDLSYAPGTPAPNYYIGSIGTATQLKQSTDGGIFHGAPVSPAEMYLTRAMLMSPTSLPLPASFILCDYLMFYPFIDESTTDEQIMTNVNTLPRYTDGKGVQVIAVSVAARSGLGVQFYFTYTNQDGVSGRVSRTVTQNTTTTNGSIITVHNNAGGTASPFIGLQSGDTGVRSIESVTMLGADVGLFTLVLVKPLLETALFETGSPMECDVLNFKEELPRIYDDAFLGYLMLPDDSGIAASSFIGNLRVIWK